MTSNVSLGISSSLKGALEILKPTVMLEFEGVGTKSKAALVVILAARKVRLSYVMMHKIVNKLIIRTHSHQKI